MSDQEDVEDLEEPMDYSPIRGYDRGYADGYAEGRKVQAEFLLAFLQEEDVIEAVARELRRSPDQAKPLAERAMCAAVASLGGGSPTTASAFRAASCSRRSDRPVLPAREVGRG